MSEVGELGVTRLSIRIRNGSTGCTLVVAHEAMIPYHSSQNSLLLTDNISANLRWQAQHARTRPTVPCVWGPRSLSPRACAWLHAWSRIDGTHRLPLNSLATFSATSGAREDCVHVRLVVLGRA